MAERITSKKLAKNVIISIIAQIISVLVSFLAGFIVPKFIDELQYSYWRTFSLYYSYVSLLHLGLLSGILLRYSQYDYEELDRARIRSQFQLLFFFTTFVALIICVVSALTLNTASLNVVILVAIGIITNNSFTYTTLTFQITNRINKYAFVVIVRRVVYAIILGVLLVCRVNNFIWYCIAELIGESFSIALGIIINKELYLGKGIGVRECLVEAKTNISFGISLLIANFASNYIIGGAQMVVQWSADSLVFGQVSFAFSISNIFMTFVTAISTVIFPSLKRTAPDKLPDIYEKIRCYVSLILFFVIILYFPGCWILEKWLPNYSSSLVYLGIVLPFIIFTTKVNLLTNNYLKAFRKERVILVINVGSVAIAFALYLLGAYVLNSLEFVLYAVVLMAMIQSVISEIVVMKIIKKKFVLDFVIELIMTLAFMLSVEFLSRWWACLVYGCALIVYAIIYRKSIGAFFHTVANLLKRKKSMNDRVL